MNQKLSSRRHPKRLDYPAETEGSRLARRIRVACNDLTPAERNELWKRAKARIYGKAKRTGA